MSVSLICTCGTRLLLEQVQPEQEVVCPECQETLKVPASSRTTRRTSTLALASVALALVGAFTLVGTVAAFLVGAVALLRILGARDRLAGAGFACLGMGMGVVFSAVTLYALMSGGVDDIAGHFRARMLAGQVDTSGPETVERPDLGFSLTRPSDEWGRVKGTQFADPIVETFARDVNFMLVQPSRYAFVDFSRRMSKQDNVDLCRHEVLDSLVPDEQRQNAVGRAPFEPPEEPQRRVSVSIASVNAIPAPVDTKGQPVRNVDGREMAVDVLFGTQRWRFLIRTYLKQPGGVLYVLRGYARADVFEQVKPELIRALDSFQLHQSP